MKFKRLLTGFLAVALLTVAAPAVAQEGSGSQDPNQAKLTKKLALPFIEKGNWFTDFDKAKQAAKEQGKPIFAYFTRSYSP